MNRVFDAPAALDIVDRRDADEERLALRPGLAHRRDHLERKAHALREAALIGERRKERVQQVAVRRVQLGDFEARGVRAPRGVAKRVDDHLPVAFLDRPRRDPALAERLRARRHRAPRPVAALGVGLGERAVAVPGARHARLASGVRELDRGDGALALHELRDAPQSGDVRVLPDAGIPVRDAPALLYRSGLDEHDARAALGELAEVDEMPVGDLAVLCRVLAHGRHYDPVPKPHLPQFQLLEKLHLTSSRPATANFPFPCGVTITISPVPGETPVSATMVEPCDTRIAFPLPGLTSAFICSTCFVLFSARPNRLLSAVESSGSPKASLEVSMQRHHGLDSRRSTGIFRSLKAWPMRFAWPRPSSVRLRCVAQSSSLKPGGSPTPGAVMAWRMKTTWPPPLSSVHRASFACAGSARNARTARAI